MKILFLFTVLLLAAQQDSCSDSVQRSESSKDKRVEQFQPTPEIIPQETATPEPSLPAQVYEDQRTAGTPGATPWPAPANYDQSKAQQPSKDWTVKLPKRPGWILSDQGDK